VVVAVDENRVRGVENILKLPQKIDVILLDDAFQHRKIKPSEQIILINSNCPIFNDRIMPYGRLRESRYGIKRADKVIVTKCPKDFSAKDREFWKKKLHLPQHIDLLFSTFDFYPPMNIFTHNILNIDKKYSFIVVTGVVSATSLYEYLANFAQKIEKIEFADHHLFSQRDILEIEKKIYNLPKENTYIIVTEKDAARLKTNPHIKPHLKDKIYSVEIKVRML
jgi:tetraacyldisaccharide 4'-kinase